MYDEDHETRALYIFYVIRFEDFITCSSKPYIMCVVVGVRKNLWPPVIYLVYLKKLLKNGIPLPPSEALFGCYRIYLNPHVFGWIWVEINLRPYLNAHVFI
jgi:hypothetical protein